MTTDSFHPRSDITLGACYLVCLRVPKVYKFGQPFIDSSPIYFRTYVVNPIFRQTFTCQVNLLQSFALFCHFALPSLGSINRIEGEKLRKEYVKN